MILSLHPIDAVVLLGYLCVVALLGMSMGKQARDLDSYLLGDRQLPWWALLGSIVATETSTATFLSVPGIAYAAQGDLRLLQLTLGFCIGRILVAVFLLPLYFRGAIFSAYEVLADRFGGITKRLAAIVFLVTRNLGDGLRLYLTAIVLQQVAGIPLPTCIAVLGLVTIGYTWFGGMRAVVWNDCLQFLIYIAGGLLASAVIANRLSGGLSEWLAYGGEQAKFRVFDFTPSLTDASSFWAAVVGGIFISLGTHGTDQMMVQRYLAAGSRQHAARALVLSGVAVCGQFTFFLLIGVGLAAFYAANPPANPFPSTDRVFASFIVNELPTGWGLIGMVLAAVFAAAMSTLSSSINSSAASALHDLYLPSTGEPAPAGIDLLRVTRWLTAAFGFLQIGIGIGVGQILQADTSAGSSNVVTEALKIAGLSSGILVGVFALGMFTRRVGQTAAAGGMLCGLVVPLLAAYGLPRFRADWQLAWPLLSTVGTLATFLGGVSLQAFLSRTRADATSQRG